MPFTPDDRHLIPRHGGELLIVRHGQSVANAQGIAQGRADYPLSDRGREQAALTAGRLAALGGIGAVYTSPLSRASQTAAIIATTLGLAPRPVEDLQELSVGALSGLSWDELKARYPEAMAAYDAAEAKRPHPKNRELIPGWEPIDAIVARIWRALLRLVAAHPGERIVAVAHGGVINAFLTHLLAGDAREIPWRHPSTNCAVTHLRFAPTGPEVTCLVDDAHLRELASGATVFDREEKLP